MNKKRNIIERILDIVALAILIALLGSFFWVPVLFSQTRGFIDTQFGSMSGLGYKFPHTALGAGFDYDRRRFGFEASGDYSFDRKYGQGSGYDITANGYGDLWLTQHAGLTAGATQSWLQTPAYQKDALMPEAGFAFRFVSGGFPMYLSTDWIFPSGKYEPATGIEPSRLRGPEIYWETQVYSHVAVGLRFGVFKGYTQGNPLCDGTLGPLTPSCARGTFTQGITVLHVRFTSKVRMP